MKGHVVRPHIALAILLGLLVFAPVYTPAASFPRVRLACFDGDPQVFAKEEGQLVPVSSVFAECDDVLDGNCKFFLRVLCILPPCPELRVGVRVRRRERARWLGHRYAFRCLRPRPVSAG